MDQTYDTPNGPKTLAQITSEMHTAGWGGDYNDTAAMLAEYNRLGTAAHSSSTSSDPTQNLLDAIASGDQQRFDEAVKEYQQTSSTNLATTLLGTAAQLQGPADYFKFNQYTSGGRDLWQQLFGSQPRADFSAPTGPITPMTLSSLMQQLGMLPATPAPTTVNPAAPAGSVPALTTNTATAPTVTPQNVTTPLSGVAASVAPAPAPAVTPQAVQSAPITPVLPIPPPSPTAQPTQPSAFTTPAPAATPTATDPTAAQKAPATTATAWQNAVQPIPLPYQINPAVWDSMGPVGQQLALSAAAAAGWDKDEYLRQINAARPQGTAPGASSTSFRTPMGAFS